MPSHPGYYSEKTAEKTAMILAVEGDLLAKHPAEDGTKRKLVRPQVLILG